MTATDAISLAITIALGLLSIGLGVFAIWFSHKLNESSSSALQAIRDLSSEIRALVQANLSTQETFSAKMLDSIIESGKYGKSEPSSPAPNALLESTIKASLDEAEQNIANAVEESLRRNLAKGTADTGKLDRAIEEIRSDIRRLSEIAPTLSASLTLPPTTATALRGFLQFPAHYVVIAALVKSGASSDEELAAVEKEFAIPEGWNRAINNFKKEGLLVEKNGGFEIPENLRTPLALWVDRNWQGIAALMARYKKRMEKGVHDEERSIAEKFEF